MTAHDLRHSAPPRTRADASALDAIDAGVREIALDAGALEMQYPTLIAREVLTRAGYPDAFPHLLMSACRCDAPDAPPAAATLAMPEWCLAPALCYHTYAHHARRVVDDGLVVTARGRCFRAEEQSEPGVRQIEFEMREIVLLGSAGWVNAVGDGIKDALEAAALHAGLSGVWQPAEDPFFLPRAVGKAMMQRLLKVKLEYQLPAAGGLALASVNRHGSFFGDRFEISTASGGTAHTACIAVGLDRWWHHAPPGRKVTR
jgi:hypothetical protein